VCGVGAVLKYICICNIPVIKASTQKRKLFMEYLAGEKNHHFRTPYK
jgi:hypothetical protein